jgi:hypothetical protein
MDWLVSKNRTPCKNWWRDSQNHRLVKYKPARLILKKKKKKKKNPIHKENALFVFSLRYMTLLTLMEYI